MQMYLVPGLGRVQDTYCSITAECKKRRLLKNKQNVSNNKVHREFTKEV